ncbi:Hypothetical protein R9X50_00438700 [Acrodontium crateriforme]|uniref:VOC domain-containing protein n=1 Tax=Acrodontium crateriforme TaxID=150365 RepID=A0AAQ3M7X9_9PEZI|nr:Hypothetical protein R9X50_00438700 [Acrodontium crateriforme]
MASSHIGIKVPPHQLAKTIAFYLAALKAFGYSELMRPTDNCVGLGVENPDFFISSDEEVSEKQKVHLAFHAKSHAEVEEFYSEAIAAGGICNGKPGPRPEYNSPTYFAAFVLDPIGNNVEAEFI